MKILLLFTTVLYICDRCVLFYYAIVDRLTMDHLQQVVDVAWPARTKYWSIGIELGLAPDIIEEIEKVNHFWVDICFTKMIKVCLRQGLLTQKKLANALSTNPVGFEHLSAEILAVKFTTPPKVARRKLLC